MGKIRIPVSKKIGPEFQCLEGWGENSNVYKKKAVIPKFGRIR